MTDGKFQFIAAVFFIVLGAVGHWAFSSLDFGKAREAVVEDLGEIDGAAQDISDITDSLADLTQEIEDSNQSEEGEVSIEEPAVNPHASLIDELESLISDQIFMKNGSNGTRVGTVQNFLNVFNDTTSTVDNDFGPGTETKVRAFQSAVGITSDGQPGPGTYQAMIDWLNENF